MKRRILSISMALVLCLGLLPWTAWAEESTPTINTSPDGTTLTIDLNGGTLEWGQEGTHDSLFYSNATNIIIRGTGAIQDSIDVWPYYYNDSNLTGPKAPVTLTFKENAQVEILNENNSNAINVMISGSEIVIKKGANVTAYGNITLGGSGSVGGTVEIGGRLEADSISVSEITIQSGGVVAASQSVGLQVDDGADLKIENGGEWIINTSDGTYALFLSGKAFDDLLLEDFAAFETTVAKFVDLKKNQYHFGSHTYTTNWGEGEIYTLLYDSDDTPVCNLTLSPVTEIIPVNNVTLSENSLTLLVDQEEQLTATVLPENTTLSKDVTWESSNPDVATVDDEGHVKALSIGTATITVKTRSNGYYTDSTMPDLKSEYTATCGITVVESVLVENVTLDKTSLDLNVGSTEQLTATVNPANATNKTVTWQSSDESVATVDADGKVTAHTPGTATITATAGGQSATCTVTVKDNAPAIIPVASISLNKKSLALNMNESETLTATVTPTDATNKTVTWQSSDESVATVDADGKVTAHAPGTATITATAGGQSATCTVTVKDNAPAIIPVNSVTLNKKSLTLNVNESETLTATIMPENATNREVTWTSSKPETAQVDENGKVTALAQGTAIITVTTANGKSATCAVTVTEATVPVPKPETYRIMYLANGGSGKMADGSATQGVAFTLPVCNFTAPGGKEFDAWSIGNADGEKLAAGAARIFTADTDVYALWKEAASPVPPTPSKPSGSTGGGSRGTVYPITVEEAVHGKVTSNLSRAARGNIVTLTVASDNVYALSALTVVDSLGNELELTGRDDGTYTFIMPGRAVTVTASFAPWNNPYTDVASNAWYYEAVWFAAENDFMAGYGGNLFGPSDNLSRGQLAQILYNLAGRPAVQNDGSFTDVTPRAWYAKAVAWAVKQGIVRGYSNGLFGPDNSITREQLAVMLWQYSESPASTGENLPFTDASEASNYALEALRWAVENGVISGKKNDLLDPQGLATRAQIAQMLKNLLAK